MGRWNTYNKDLKLFTLRKTFNGWHTYEDRQPWKDIKRYLKKQHAVYTNR